MEKMKDILYDISDIIISLLIIAVIFFVISWKLNESMPISYQAESLSTSEPEQSEPSLSASTDDINTEDIPLIEDEKPIDDEVIVTEPEVITPPAVTESPEQSPATPVGTEVSFEVPSGSTGFAIAKLLRDQGFISDINAFISKVEEMGLGAKLRSGTFTLKTDMSEEQIIKILAGVRD